jgi:chlorophyll synthase
LYIGIGWTLLSLAVAASLGVWVLAAASVGLLFAWVYSAPPLRLKQNGWWGNTACALCYEGLPWLTGAIIVAAVLPDWRITSIALLYSVGAHGIMTLNDFKSIDGDRAMGIRTLPVQLGVNTAVRVACWVMLLPQMVVIALLALWQHPWAALIVGLLLIVQLLLMARLLEEPARKAPWYNATGTTLYVVGMLATAFALRTGGTIG